jgi:glycerophosphoryl diester phosphodiesterase
MRSSRFVPDPLLAGSAGFAHRGLHGPGVPENSLAAFRAAIDAGAGIECDLRLSRDGVAMVFHDRDLNRLCGTDVSPESLYADALMTMRLDGGEESIPLLGQLLELASETTPLLLELKRGPGPISQLCRAVESSLRSYSGPVAVMSFDADVGRWFSEHAPHIRRGLVLDGRDSWWRREAKLRRARPDLIAVRVDAITRPWVARCRESGVDVACWTVRTASERETAAVHADSLIWEADGRP